MASPARSVLAALVSTTVVVTLALAWAGWRLLDQQRALDEQRAGDRAESAADALAAGIRGKLAEAGERLSAWIANPGSSVPAIEGAVVVGVHAGAIAVTPAGGLPFVPVASPSNAVPAALAIAERTEFTGDPRDAMERYRRLANHPDAHVRAGALLRLGRVQRKAGNYAGAVQTYEKLAALGAVRTDDLPAELAGLRGLQSARVAMGDQPNADEAGRRILDGLDSGRWVLARGAAELYREPFPAPRPDSWRLAAALGEVWRETGGALPSRGQRIFSSDDGSGPAAVVVWRSNGSVSAAFAALAPRFFASPATLAAAWQLVDPEGRVINGEAVAPTRSAVRIIGNSEYPWTLRAWVAPASDAQRGRAVVFLMIGAAFAFVWGATYFMARALRREAAVARLQSDFVAAVSHEFRSPLTTVRQMAEMLDEDRVPTEERRHKYYKVLAAEAARLQRLVETLLNFGRMESGAARYRFAELDAAALVREVVKDAAPQARESGKVIEVDGTDTVTVRADQDALSLALRNLIDNAIKYSPGEQTVWVQCRRQLDQAAICVVDRGVGVPRSEQRSIFDKFVRGRAAIERNIKGTGVGLSMVQQIVAAHGGEIRLESEPGHGSTFTLLLPAVN